MTKQYRVRAKGHEGTDAEGFDWTIYQGSDFGEATSTRLRHIFDRDRIYDVTLEETVRNYEPGLPRLWVLVD